MELWQWRKEMDKLNEVEKSFYNTMCRNSKHIKCPNIVLKKATKRQRFSGYLPYGLYCQNHRAFLGWIKADLMTFDAIDKWSKLGIERVF